MWFLLPKKIKVLTLKNCVILCYYRVFLKKSIGFMIIAIWNF
jgi:hypothetical protein